jgi:hypothetical protein
MNNKDLIFIDANQYLDLYGIPSGKKLLAALQEQQHFVFVTAQIVDEVNRNKVKITARFLTEGLKNLELSGTAVPEHLVSNMDERVAGMDGELERTRRRVKATKASFENMAHYVLEQVSQSKDEISKGLEVIFSRAISPTQEELERARARKERGNPPGKRDDPLGDELSWEQILSRCKDKPRLWIITKDSDYGTVCADKMFLNAVLYQQLARLYKSEPVVFCFDNIAKGLERFVQTTGAKAKKLPTPEETEQIKREQESIPSTAWLDDDAFRFVLQFQDTLKMGNAARLTMSLGNQSTSEVVIPATAIERTDKHGA